MSKSLVMFFLLLVLVTPALAEPKNVYPVACVDLWAAVKDSLDNPHNYAIISMNDLALSASFKVIGNLTAYTDRIALTTQGTGCAMKSAFLQIGSDDSDWRQFRHRMERSLAKVQAAKQKPEALATGQMQ